MKSASPVHVAVGVIRDSDGRILITQRARHVHQGGLWEFPGGKLEAGENVLQALRRELQEEVGIEVQSASPLIKINYRYPDRHVVLDVWQVHRFVGQAYPCEQQAMHWVAPHRLKDYTFPAANQPIISAALLPDRYAILEATSYREALNNLKRIITNRVELLQLRVKSLPNAELEAVVQEVSARCRSQQIKLLLNSDLPIRHPTADGIHLSSGSLLACNERPAQYPWVGASCHNLDELKHAERIGVDFVVLAPVLPTATHPNATLLGWNGLSTLIEQVNLPVFALGGLGTKHLAQAISAGAQGIAGISAFL